MLIKKVNAASRLWLHFYSVSEFPPNRLCFNWEPRELVWKSIWSILHRNFVSKFHIFSNFSKKIIWFSDFSDSRPKKIGFWVWGRFCLFCWSKKLPICLQYWQLSINVVWSVIKVDRIYVIINMALALFHKQLYKHRNICKRVSGKSGFFSIELPIELPIDSGGITRA